MARTTPRDAGSPHAPAWPVGGGEMGARIRAHDWTMTPLETWPQSLRTAVALMLGMRQPACLWWGGAPGVESRLLYNDAYRTILGPKHPDALGRTMAEVWPELVDTTQHPLEVVRAQGPQLFVDREFVLAADADADGAPRSRWFTSTWTPLPDETGAVLGVFNASFETTERVLAERALRASEARQAVLLRLSDALRPLADPWEIQAAATRLLREQFDAGWCYYVEWDERGAFGEVLQDATREGLPSLAGRHDVSDVPDYLDFLRSGQAFSVGDFARYELMSPRIRARYGALGFRSMVGAPIVNDGRLVTTLLVGDTAQREWSDDAVTLVRDVADRTWTALARARAAEALRASAARQAFLLTLSDTLRAEPDADAVADRALRMLSAHLRLDRSYIVSYRLEDDRAYLVHQRGNDTVPPLPDVFVLSDYPAAFRAVFDRTLVIEDERARPGLSEAERRNSGRLGMRALVAATVRKGQGRPLWSLVAISSVPRRWTQDEIALVEEVAERTWAAMEQARAEAALRVSEARFRAVANLVPDLLWESDPDGATRWYNQRWMEYTGQTSAEATGWGWTEAIHPDDRDASTRRYRAAVVDGAPLRQEHRIRRHDGAYRWFVVTTVPLRGDGGTVVTVYGAATDIHEERTAREGLEQRVAERTAELAAAVDELRTSEGRLRLLVEQMPAALWTTDRELRLTALMGAAVPAAAQAGIGQTMPDFLFANAGNAAGIIAAVEAHRRALAGIPGGFEAETAAHTYAGHVEPLRDGDGRIVGVIGVAHDVTERALLRLQDEFLALASHELRTPLTPTLGYLEMALTTLDGATPSPARRYVARAVEQVGRLDELVGDLLDVGRLRGGQMRLEREEVDLGVVVRRAVEAAEVEAGAQGQAITLEAPEEPLLVAGDARRLEQVALNLLTNAVKYAAQSPAIAVRLGRDSAAGQAVLEVQDAGPGIAAADLPHLFSRFYQVARSDRPSRGGLGLGLYLVQQLVEAHGGTVGVTSTVGEGTTFTVRLPLRGTGAGPPPRAVGAEEGGADG